MRQAVLDANTLASGAVAPSGGTLATIIDLWQQGVFSVILSTHILRELERTFSDPYFLNRLSAEEITLYLAMVQATVTVVPITEQVHNVASHPEDDLVLATAVSGGAEYLVTGDRKLQQVREYRGVRILSPHRFLEILGSEGSER